MADLTTKYVYVTYIASTPEKVWAALTAGGDDQGLLPRHRTCPTGRRARPGPTRTGDGTADVVGEVMRVRPAAEARPDVGLADGPGRPSRVTLLIEPFMDAVRLTVIHEDLEPDSPMHQGVSQGWPAILSSLKSLLETGGPCR